jgi:predicted RNA-binding Zn-ribbon protein involved in translation (DUF1610 family)
MEILLALGTVIVVALALALAPGRWRRPPGARPARRPGGAAFLGVCGSCLEIVETTVPVERCPACGARLVARQRIVDRRSPRRGAPVA